MTADRSGDGMRSYPRGTQRPIFNVQYPIFSAEEWTDGFVRRARGGLPLSGFRNAAVVFNPPDGVVGGSNDMNSGAVWSRHDPVPVLSAGYSISEIAL